jgi:hypothetical protein
VATKPAGQNTEDVIIVPQASTVTLRLQS